MPVVVKIASRSIRRSMIFDTPGTRPPSMDPKEWALINCTFSRNYLLHRKIELERELAAIKDQLSNLEKNMIKMGMLKDG